MRRLGCQLFVGLKGVADHTSQPPGNYTTVPLRGQDYYRTVPVAAYAWYRHFGDFAGTLSAVLDCGGDTDTTGAIVGALAGAVTGEQGIPPEWLSGIVDWPRGRQLLRAIADRLAQSTLARTSGQPVRYFWPGLIPRNALFLAVVLLYGLRRLAPPY